MKQIFNYNNFHYDTIGRWCSYWHQITEVLKLRPNNILEIGVGNNTVKNYFQARGIKVAGLDINKENNPDIVASVEKIPLDDNSFDLVLCAEVLEHLPFAKFGICLKEINRIGRKYAVISLPHWGRHFSIEARLPYFKNLRWQYKLNLFPIKHHFNSQHYWEIGKRNYPLKKIKNAIRDQKFKILNDYCVFEMPYHHFFILEKL